MADAPPEGHQGGPDPLSIGLAAYFVLLILTVAALLVLPALL